MREPRYRQGRPDELFAEPPAFDGYSEGYREAELVGAASGSRHTYLVVAELAGGGHVGRHAHTHEEAFFVLEGAVELTREGSRSEFERGGFGLVGVGETHAWRNTEAAPARWVSMNAPLPLDDDPTFDLDDDADRAAAPALVDHVRGITLVPVDERGVGGYRPGDMTGVSIDWLVDDALGADLLKLFMVRYGPGGGMGRHEHPVEESYLVLTGEVHCTADAVEMDLGPGDFLWTGVGCVHSFENRTREEVIWIETQAPQPPRNHPVRFIARVAR